MKLKPLIFVLACSLLMVLLCAPARAENGGTTPKVPGGPEKLYTDVTPGHWAYEQIKRLTEQGIIRGYPDGSFRPQKKVQRKEFAVMLASVAGLLEGPQKERVFADVAPGSWYGPAAAAVRRYLPGITETDGLPRFHPDTDATRQDVTAALVKALGAKYYQVNPMILQEKFTDYQSINPNFRLQLGWAVQNNIIKGYPDGSFKPLDGITRAEVAVMLYRAYFLDTSIEGMIQEGQIKPFTAGSAAYSKLTGMLKEKYGQITLHTAVYQIDYYAREQKLYGGEGPQLLYVFGSIEPKYYSWEADFQRDCDAVREFNKAAALEAAKMYPHRNLLVMLGHTFDLYFDVSDVYDKKYLTKTSDGWRLDRFYTGVMCKNGDVVQVWLESPPAEQPRR